MDVVGEGSLYYELGGYYLLEIYVRQ